MTILGGLLSSYILLVHIILNTVWHCGDGAIGSITVCPLANRILVTGGARCPEKHTTVLIRPVFKERFWKP